jgi:N-acetyl-gamma-glutamyl-phosphate reductase
VDVGIVGGSGYGGAELVRLLEAHPSAKLRTVAARSQAGNTLGAVFPHLAASRHAGDVLAPAEPEALAGCALVFLATPHEASLALAPPLLDAGALVVDLSGAFRLDAATFTAAYGTEHTAPGLAPAAYGLPELFRNDLDGARLVASPGCYPTAALLALAPLAGLVDAARVVVTGMSGTSGAGKGLHEDLHASHAFGNVAPYGAGRHRHAPEITRGWARLAGDADPDVTFTPHLVPASRGLLCTVVAPLEADPASVRRSYEDAYRAEPFVTLLPDRAWPATTHVVGGNCAHVAVTVDAAAGTVVASAAIDNLVKGAAGQAIQAANVLLGFPEGTGLPTAGVYP